MAKQAESEPAGKRERLWEELDLFGDETPPADSAPLLWSTEEEGPPAPAPAPRSSNGAGQSAVDLRARLVALLGPAPVNIDDLVRAMQCPAAEVRALLFELAVAGRLARYGGDLVALIPA